MTQNGTEFKASWLLSKPRRYDLMAATMLGTGKNVWQAEIDAAVELIDFWRLGTNFVQDMYSKQPPLNAEANWNRVEYRPLEGFVLAISPFNFAAIGGNLPSTPAMVGNTCVWKPSSTSILSNWYTYQILKEAGLPDGVINWLPCSGAVMCILSFFYFFFCFVFFSGVFCIIFVSRVNISQFRKKKK